MIDLRRTARPLGILGALGIAVAATAAAPTPPVPAVMVEEASLPRHTVYRPASLAAYGRAHRLPVVVWGNGGCVPAGNSSAPFLTELASHGYLVIASGPVADLAKRREGPPPPAPGNPGGAPGGGGPPPGAPGTADLTTTHQLVEAMDWAQAENRKAGSPYEGKLDPMTIAAMGSSCGGLQAIEIAGDPRVKTLALWSSGLLDVPRAGAMASRDDLGRAHGPILYVVGDAKNDGANPHAYKDYELLAGKPVVIAEEAGAVHGEPLGKPGGGAWGPVGVAWLDWQFKGDKAAGRMFTGADGGLLARRPGWTIRSKGF